MKKHRYWSWLLLLLCLAACKKETISLCADPECETYLAVWEKRMLSNSNISQAYFDAHVKPVFTRITSGKAGLVFGVNFTIQMDWAEVEAYDGFYVNLHADDTIFTNPQLPHDRYLTEAEILGAVDQYPDYYACPIISPITALRYHSKADAMQALRKATDGTLHFHSIFISLGGFADLPKDGHPYLLAQIGKTNTDGSIVYGILDLLTGESKTHLQPR